jgi:ADP-ribose pyrophosphatase YjhB (NUDIX family)
VVGVGAVVVHRDSVLLVKRSHPPLQGEWSLPGGVVELGESLPDAVRREVLEETGVAVEVGALVEVFERVERGPDDRVEYHYVIVDYLCRVTPGHDGRAICGSDAADACWASVQNLSQYRLTTGATAAIRKALTLAGRS